MAESRGTPTVPAVADAGREGVQATLMHLYVFGVCSVALAALLLSFRSERADNDQFSIPALAFFILMSYVADRHRLKVNDRTEVSAGFLADFLSGALLGVFGGIAVSGSAAISSYAGKDWERNAFFWAAFSITGGSCAFTYHELNRLFEGSDYGIAIAGLVAGTLYLFVNTLLFIPVAWLRRSVGPWEYCQEALFPFIPFHFFFLVLSLGLLYAGSNLALRSLAFFMLPLFGLMYAFRAFSKERALVQKLETFSLEIVSSMITALDMKDNYTAQHSAAVAQYSADIASSLGLPQRVCRTAHMAGLLHDLGKISVPDTVLNWPGSLSEMDWEVIEKHPIAGRDIIQNVKDLDEIGEIIAAHHERYDGSGYPQGVSGEAIPIVSRIVSVADAYSAMVSDRPYRDALVASEAIRHLTEGSGKLFDPEIVDVFISVLGQKSVAYRTSGDTNFQVEFQKVRLREQML